MPWWTRWNKSYYYYYNNFLQVSDENRIFEDEIAIYAGIETSRELGIRSRQSSSVDLQRSDLTENPDQVIDPNRFFRSSHISSRNRVGNLSQSNVMSNSLFTFLATKSNNMETEIIFFFNFITFWANYGFCFSMTVFPALPFTVRRYLGFEFS